VDSHRVEVEQMWNNSASATCGNAEDVSRHLYEHWDAKQHHHVVRLHGSGGICQYCWSPRGTRQQVHSIIRRPGTESRHLKPEEETT